MTPENKQLAEKIFIEKIGSTRFKLSGHNTLNEIFEAMDAYHNELQEKESVEFIEWVVENHWRKIGETWHNMVDNTLNAHTTQQLYKIYKESKQKS